MSAMNGPVSLAETGSTGNNSHTGVGLNPNAHKVAIGFVVEAVGATPTVTYKVQGSFNGTDWFDLIMLPADSETAAATKVVTAAGTYVTYLAQAAVRFARYLRLVTSANTNVTYKGELFQHVAP